MNIEHIALNVADPVPLSAWYVQHLGLKVVRRVEGGPNTHFLADSAGRTVLEIYGHAKAQVPDYPKLDALTLHIAFVVEDVQFELERLLKAGATRAGDIVTTETGDVMTFLKDPWGVTLQLVKRARPLM